MCGCTAAMMSLTQLLCLIVLPSLDIAPICVADTATSTFKPEEEKQGKALTSQVTIRNPAFQSHPIGPNFVHGHTSVQRSLGNVVFN